MTMGIVGVDKSDASTRAMDLAVDWATFYKASLLVVHVINWSPYSFTTAEDNESRGVERKEETKLANAEVLDPMVRIAADAGIEHESLLRYGKPSEVISDLALERKAMMIFVGRTGDAGLREAIFGSVVGRLAQQAPVAVTVVP